MEHRTTTSSSTHPVETRLETGWIARAVSGPIPPEFRGVSVPATVPGSIHTDLFAAGLIPDPYLDNNEALLGWIGLVDWQYELALPAAGAEAERIELDFGGLDTVALIELNGVELGRTRNMHRSYRFDITDTMTDGDNTLRVTFSSAIRAADAASLQLGYRPHVNHHPYNALRKMACSFGWDWGIDTSTCGMWKPVVLRTWGGARMRDVRVVPTVGAAASGRIDVFVAIDRTTPAELELVVRAAGAETRRAVASGDSVIRAELELPDVQLWWPRGHGAQPLYDIEIELVADGEVADATSRRIGFRTVSFDVTPDASGTPFTIVVNGRPIFVRGANWIPDDAFPHRVDRARYARRLEQAEFAGLNLIRVWGGGIYESDDFYAECDERGLLVWQDFLLACAAYAEEQPLFGEIEAEAREAITRLGSHPSLAVLNGNNENLWGHDEWNWPLRLDGRTWGAGYYYELFPALVEELAPHVGYTPGSPFSPDRTHRPNDPDHGSMHIWDLWNQRDYPEYRTYTPRFVAEFGWQGPPAFTTMRRSISDDPLTPESPGMLVHQKAAEGNVKLTDGLLPHLPLPNEIDAWHWAMSLNQAVAIRTAIEHFRSLAPHCMGSIVWQLNDCWPVTSWAAVDGDGRAKPLLYALQQAHAERAVTVQPRGDGLVAVVTNDTGAAWSGLLATSRIDFTGRSLAEHTVEVSVPARGTATFELPASVSAATDAGSELVRVQLADARALWFFAEYRDSALGDPGLTTTVDRIDDGYRVTVTAGALVRDLALLIDKVDPDATVDRMLVTLLPAETAVFTVTSRAELDAAALTAPTVLRSANQLVAR